MTEIGYRVLKSSYGDVLELELPVIHDRALVFIQELERLPRHLHWTASGILADGRFEFKRENDERVSPPHFAALERVIFRRVIRQPFGC